MSDLTDAAFGTLAGPLKDALDALESDVAKEYADRLAQAALDVKAAQDATLGVQGKYDALQAKYDAYVAAHPDTTTPPPPPPPPPAKGIAVGAAWGGGTDVAPLEKRLGSKLAGHRTYYGPTEVAKALTVIEADLKAGRLSFVSFKLPGSWADMAAGKQDAWVKGLAAKVKALGDKYGAPVYVTFHHEPEGDGTQRDWTAMLAHCAPLMRSTHVRFGAVLQGYHSVPKAMNPGGPMDWPIATVIPPGLDFVGFDPYETYGNVNGSTAFRNWDAYYAYLAGEVSKLGIPEWGVAEIGVTLAAFTKKPTWFADNVATADKYGAGFWLYFDSDGGGSTSHWRMDTNNVPDAREAAFGAAAKAHQ